MSQGRRTALLVSISLFLMTTICLGAFGSRALPPSSTVRGVVPLAPSQSSYDDGRGVQYGSKTCVEAACSYLDDFRCDDADELRIIANYCSQNFDGSCVDFVCSRLSDFGCDDLNEIKEVTRSCSFTSGKCVRDICDRLPESECDDLAEVTSFASACSYP